MFLTVHTATALAITQLPLPTGAIFVLALLSHYLLDIVPHGDEGLVPENFDRQRRINRMILIATIDGLLIAGLLGFFYFIGLDTLPLWTILIAVFLACLPDGLQFLHYLTRQKNIFLKIHQDWHDLFHNPAKIDITLFSGLIIHLLVLIIILGLWMTK